MIVSLRGLPMIYVVGAVFGLRAWSEEGGFFFHLHCGIITTFVPDLMVFMGKRGPFLPPLVRPQSGSLLNTLSLIIEEK